MSDRVFYPVVAIQTALIIFLCVVSGYVIGRPDPLTWGDTITATVPEEDLICLSYDGPTNTYTIIFDHCKE